MTNMFKPDLPSKPAAAPKPPKLEAPKLEIGGQGSEDIGRKKKAAGRSSLRIDRTAVKPTPNGTGINVPQG